MMSLFRSSPAPAAAAAPTQALPIGGGQPLIPAGGLFGTTASNGAVQVADFFVAGPSGLAELSAPAPLIRTPQDDGIAPGEGDDTTAPNATTAARLNRVVCVTSANVGYSKAAKDQILPSALEYVATVEEFNGDFGLTLQIILEYESSFPQEGMVVWMKKHQQLICDETEAELMLVETSFQDLVRGEWVSISTDVRYAEEAEAVVQAVITTDSGQTAGRVKTEGSVEDAKLGPVGERGRIILTYRCNKLYSYAEMAMEGDGNGQRNLVPLALQLPWGALDNPGNNCSVKATVNAPSGTRLLDHEKNILAYRDLQQSLTSTGSQVAIVPANSGATQWAFERSALPPCPTMVLAWLSIPDADEGWEQLPESLPKATRATLMRPSAEDLRLLGVTMPGKQDAHLVRCQVETEAPTRLPASVRVHTDITISDASGSTGMRRGPGGENVRSGFNKYEELRLMKRLEAIPKLREAGVLLENDIWNQIWVVFHHGVKQEFSIESSVGELDSNTVANLVQALSNSGSGEANLRQAGKGALLDKWKSTLQSLRSVAAGGATSFVQGTDRAKSMYRELVTSRHSGKACTAYVNFDTDGGNNCGPCYAAIKGLVAEADVVQGHVMGIGAWVDQDCATRVAKLLKGTVSLNLTFPESAQADRQFREDLSRWIRAIRTTPVSVTVSAGSVAWAARHGDRHENGVDVLFASKGNSALKFDQPDVSEPNYTKAVLGGLQAGESTTMYLLSRWPLEQLAAALRVDVGGMQAQVAVASEPLQGVGLGHHWLSLLAGSPDVATNAASLCTRLRQRLEDELSFAWNLPTKSGSTAAVGRAKTDRRPPVPKEKQPDEPQVQSTALPAPAPRPLVGKGWGGGRGGGPILRCSAAAPAPPMPAAAPQAAAACAAPYAPSALPAPSAAAASLGPLRVAKAEEKCKKAMSRRRPPAGRPMGALLPDDADVEMGTRPPNPSHLLRLSGFMRIGSPETPQEAARRAIQSLKHLATQAVLPPKPQMTGHIINEDPLVADVLGSQASQGGYKHTGFVCDVTSADPIVGVRYKATNLKDVDITEDCRRQGRYPAGAGGFRAIADAAAGLRFGLAAALGWWQVLWKSRADLFADAAPKLADLPVASLAAAVQNLPDM